MKKIQTHLTKHQIQAQHKKAKRQHQHKVKKKVAICRQFNMPLSKKIRQRKVKRITIPAPKIIGFYNSKTRTDLMQWINELRQKVEIQRQKIFIDFSRSRKPEAAGVLRLLSELARLQSLRGEHFIRGNSPTDDITVQAFAQIGLLKLIKSTYQPSINHPEVRYWRHTSGDDIDAQSAGRLIEGILKLDEDDSETTGALFDGISEAITNVVMHAYDVQKSKSTPRFALRKKWWVFTGIKDGNLVLLVCDTGIGIPNSLRVKHEPSKLHELLKQVSLEFQTADKDSKTIKAAMEIGRSSSEEHHRGLGMPQLKSLIDNIKEGSLFILSNRGHYTYGYDGTKKKESLKDFNSSILGTIVGWRVPLSKLTLLSEHLKHEHTNHQHS